MHRPSRPAACALLAVAVASATATAQVTVARFRDDRAGALSFTFDDGSQTQYDVAVPELESFGMRGSFYLIAGYTRDTQGDPIDPRIPSEQTWARVSWDQWADTLARGHEIGNHTMTHQHLPLLTTEDRRSEIVDARALIASKLGVAPLTFVCPYNDGRTNPDVTSIIFESHIAIRMTEYTYGSAGRNTLADLNAVADNAVSGTTWNIPMVHGLGEPWSPLDPQLFHDHLAYCKGLVDSGQLWVDTFANVFRYQQERDQIAIDVRSSAGTRTAFAATCSLDPSVYDVPLTFIVDTSPDTAETAGLLREGTTEPIGIEIQPGRLLVTAPPGAGAITVAWTTDPANGPPAVNAGPDRTVQPNVQVDLEGSVTDATVPGTLVCWWELVSGPDAVTFDPGGAEVSAAAFPVEGEYVVRLCADDGELLAFDAATITVCVPADDDGSSGCAAGRGRTFPLALGILAAIAYAIVRPRASCAPRLCRSM